MATKLRKQNKWKRHRSMDGLGYSLKCQIVLYIRLMDDWKC